MSEESELEERIEGYRAKAAELRKAIEASFIGHQEAVDLLLFTLLAGGHALLEGAPGLGKTTLVKGVASALELNFQRIQFTPDLMPADILGARVLEETDRGGHVFRFERGPIFAQIVLADEVNRATPRTQSALLEAMAESQVTVHGEEMPLEAPFCVIATQNPIEMEGTYPLPEAQLDRFICKVEIRSPTEADLLAILGSTTGAVRETPQAVLNAGDVLAMRSLVREMPISSDAMGWIARTLIATDPARAESHETIQRSLRVGASPRGGQALVLLSKARAFLRGRTWVADEDIEAVARPALRHRLVYSYEGEAGGVPADELVGLALESARASA